MESLAFVNTKYANRSADRPDIEFEFAGGSIASDSGTTRAGLGITERTFSMYAPLVGRESYSFTVFLTQPKSRGSVRLRSRDPFAKPIFEAGYFTHPDDVKVLVEGMKFGIAIINSKVYYTILY